MASKSGSGKKSGGTRNGDAGDKDRLGAELKERVAVLENELRLKQSDTVSREIVDRKLMGEYLVLFQRMVDKAADMVFLLGPLGRILYANEAACKALGYTREELQSMTVFDFNQKHHVDNWLEHEEKLKKQGSMTFENEFKTKDGGLIPVEICANYARLGDKEYNYSFIRDITERKQMEKELRNSRDELEVSVRERTAELSESEAMLRQIIETSPVPMVVYREEKNYHINKKFTDTFGYTYKDIPSVQEWWPLAYPDEAYREFVKNRWYAAVDEAVKDKASIAPQEVIVACKDGSRKDVLADFSSIGDMNLAILQDISERKRAEEALRESEERYRGLFESSRDGIAITDMAGSILKTNPAFQRMLGYSEEDLRHLNYQQLTPARWYKMEMRIIQELVIGRGYSDEYEKEYIRKDGTIFPISIRTWLIKDKHGMKEGMWAIVRDITERKRAEEALRESEEMLRSFFNLPLIGMALTSPEKGWIYANDRICEILGYSRKELFRLTWDNITHPDDLNNDLEYFDRLLSGEIDSYTIEKRFVRKDNSKVNTQISIGCVRNRDKSVRYIAGLMQDITERKRAGEALAASHRQIQSIIDNTPAIVYAFDLEERFVMANTTVAELLNSTPEQMIGKRRHEFMPREDADWHEANDRQVIEAGQALEFEEYSQLKGRSITWLTTKFPLRDAQGRIYAVAGISADITERKRAEEELRESRSRLEAVFGSMAEGVIIFDSQGRIISINDSALKIFGYERFDLVHRSSSEYTPTYELCDLDGKLLPVQEWPINRVLRGEAFTHYEVTVNRKDTGHTKALSYAGVPIRDGENRIILAVLTIEDITERKRVEKEMRETKAQAELYVDLMGHDINNMHQIALGYLELAREMPPGEEHAVFLDKPVEVLQRSAQLIQNVRKLQKLQDRVFKTEMVDVCRVLSDVHREFGAIPNKRVSLNVNGYEHCFVRANELLHDVFANLVSNAIKHTGDRTEIAVDLDIVKDNGNLYYRVAVEDDGPGIPDEFKAKIFNRMLEGTAKAKGMGLGLYLVKSLVDSYGGRILAEDRVKDDHTKGARFVVMLPAVEK